MRDAHGIPMSARSWAALSAVFSASAYMAAHTAGESATQKFRLAAHLSLLQNGFQERPPCLRKSARLADFFMKGQ